MKAVILGGTGTLGYAMTKKLLDSGYDVLIVSRCELKQKLMAKEFNNKKLSFALGDIRDADQMFRVTRGAFVVFLFAALKHVEILEDNPEESIRTNIEGVINVADACEANGINNLVFSSSDKAVDPINTYGMCKGISEKLLLKRNEKSSTNISVFRWGNVIGSRGSVIKDFANSLRLKKEVYVTDINMTRFWLKIEDAVDFMFKEFQYSLDDVRIFSPKCASIVGIVEAIAECIDVPNYQIVTTGIRKGEKLHEVLRSSHSGHTLSSHSSERYTKEELVELVRPFS